MAKFLSRGVEFDSELSLFSVGPRKVKFSTGCRVSIGGDDPNISYMLTLTGDDSINNLFWGDVGGAAQGRLSWTTGAIVIGCLTTDANINLTTVGTGKIKVSSLAGVGSRAVVADANGVLTAP